MSARLGSALALAFLLVSCCFGRLPPDEKTVIVFAAASLKESFEAIGRKFEGHNPRVRVLFNFGGSQQLVGQLMLGARADVLTTADAVQMDRARKSGLAAIAPYALFATNSLVVVVPAEARQAITSIKGLSKTGLRLVVAAPAVPAGAYAAIMLAKAGKLYGARWRSEVESRIVSREDNVRSVLAKVALGEADAGIVYLTDAISAGRRVKTLPIPANLNVIATYPAVTLKESREPELAASFVRFLGSPEARAILRQHGFGPPVEAKRER